MIVVLYFSSNCDVVVRGGKLGLLVPPFHLETFILGYTYIYPKEYNYICVYIFSFLSAAFMRICR